MRVCEFNKNLCVFTKKKCDSPNFKKCKYYLRQHPVDQDTFSLKVFKTLKNSISKRDIFDELKIDYSTIKINFEKSVYENVKNIVDTIKFPIITIKERKKIDPHNNSVVDLINNLYEFYDIEILQKIEKDNSLLILDKNTNQKFIYFLNSDLKEFIPKLKKSSKKDKVIREYVKRVKSIG